MATKNIVPNADSEGGIGTSSKYWATGFIDAITTTGNLVIGGSIDLEGDIDVNGTTNLDIVDIDGAVNMATTALVTGVLTTTAATVFNGGFTSNAASTISTADNLDTLSLISTDADANAGPNLRLFRNSASPADSDVVGLVEFEGKNSAGTTVRWAGIESKIVDVTDSTEDGSLELVTTLAGSGAVSRILMNATETVINESSKDLDFRVESDNLTSAFFIDGANGNATFGGEVALAGMLAVTHGTIGDGESVGLKIVNSAGSKTWNLTVGQKDVGNDFFTIRCATTDVDALVLDTAGKLTVKDDLIIKTGGTIGGASDPDLLTLAADTLTLTHANSGIFFQSVGPVNSDNSTNNFRMALYHNGANNLIPTAKTGFTAAGNAVFLGDTGVDIIIGTGNSSGAPSNSFIGLEHGGNVTMNAGASTPDIPAFKLDDADDITLTRGSLIIGTPGEGIDFTAENTGRLGGSATDRTASVLDDYEEGTWTPTFLGCSFTGTVTAKYTKIGRKVFISLFFINQTIASSSGGGGFGGLPFSKGGSSYYAPILISNADSVSSPASGFIRTHDVTMNLNVGSSVSDASWINGTNNRSMMLSGTYMV